LVLLVRDGAGVGNRGGPWSGGCRGCCRWEECGETGEDQDEQDEAVFAAIVCERNFVRPGVVG